MNRQLQIKTSSNKDKVNFNIDADNESFFQLATLINDIDIYKIKNNYHKNKSKKINKQQDKIIDITDSSNVYDERPMKAKFTHQKIHDNYSSGNTNPSFNKIWKVITNTEVIIYKKNIRNGNPITQKDNKKYTKLFSFSMLCSNNLYDVITQDIKVLISSIIHISGKIINSKALIILTKNEQEFNKLYIAKENGYKHYVMNNPIMLDIDTINSSSKMSKNTDKQEIIYKLKLMNGKKNIDTFIFNTKQERYNWKNKLKSYK